MRGMTPVWALPYACLHPLILLARTRARHLLIAGRARCVGDDARSSSPLRVPMPTDVPCACSRPSAPPALAHPRLPTALVPREASTRITCKGEEGTLLEHCSSSSYLLLCLGSASTRIEPLSAVPFKSDKKAAPRGPRCARAAITVDPPAMLLQHHRCLPQPPPVCTAWASSTCSTKCLNHPSPSHAQLHLLLPAHTLCEPLPWPFRMPT